MKPNATDIINVKPLMDNIPPNNMPRIFLRKRKTEAAAHTGNTKHKSSIYT